MPTLVKDKKTILDFLKSKNTRLEDSRVYDLWWKDAMDITTLTDTDGLSLYSYYNINSKSQSFYLIFNINPTICYELKNGEVYLLDKQTKSEAQTLEKENEATKYKKASTSSFSGVSNSIATRRKISYNLKDDCLDIKNPWMYDDVSYMVTLEDASKKELLTALSENIILKPKEISTVNPDDLEVNIFKKHKKNVDKCEQRKLHRDLTTEKIKSFWKEGSYSSAFHQPAKTPTVETTPLLAEQEPKKTSCPCNLL